MAEKQSATGKTIVNASLVRDYVDGKLDSVMQSKVAAFLEKHPKLLEQAAAMSGDGFLDRVRAVQVESGTPDQSLGPRSVSMAPDASPDLPAGDSKPSDIPAELNDVAGYEIVKELGRGGMGVVYLAKNVNMGGRLEVLKVLNDRLVSVPEAKERFLREISSVAMLNHPSIVTAYSVLPLSNMLVFSMEYVQGTDLHKFIRQNNPLPIALACSIAQQIASGLQHGHERGLVHRDIKPSNIMIFRSGKKLAAKILDYGLAKATSEKASDGLTQNGMMLGTPEYIAPEQMLNAANSTICADIYSLGCTLYHMLSGQPPFKGTVGEVMMAHAQIEAPMIHLIRTDVPIELSTVIAKMMAKDPSRRYQTPGELIAVLKPFTNKPATVIAQTELPGPVDASTRDTDGIAARADLDTSVEAKHSELLSILSQPRQTTAKLNKKPTLFGKRFSNRNSGVGITTGLILLLGMGAIWFSGILTVKTANGTLVIENLPSDADVTVDGERVKVTWKAGKESAELSLKPGNHEVEVRRGDLIVAGMTVTIVDGEQSSWTVTSQTQLQKDNQAIFQVGDVYEGNWTNYAAGQTAVAGSSRMTVVVKERTDDDVTTEWMLETWGGQWQFKGKVFMNKDGSAMFRSTDSKRLNRTHENEGNTVLVLELDSTGKQFTGQASYTSGGRSKFDATRAKTANHELAKDRETFSSDPSERTSPRWGQELIVNGGCEDPLSLTGWRAVQGGWQVRDHDPPPFNGGAYFNARPGALSELEQTVELDSYREAIQTGLVQAIINGYTRSWRHPDPSLNGRPDTSEIIVEFLDIHDVLLSSTSSGKVANLIQWQRFHKRIELPEDTAKIRFRLISERNFGKDNDGYFDDLSMVLEEISK